ALCFAGTAEAAALGLAGGLAATMADGFAPVDGPAPPGPTRRLGYGLALDLQQIKGKAAGQRLGFGEAHGHALPHPDFKTAIRALQGLGVGVEVEKLVPDGANRDQPIGAGLVQLHESTE